MDEKDLTAGESGWVEKVGYATRMMADSEALSSPGTQIELVRFGKGKYKHYHKQKTEAFYFIGGSGRAVIDGEERSIQVGSFVLMKPGVVHEWINDFDEPLEAVMVKTNNSLDDTFTE